MVIVVSFSHIPIYTKKQQAKALTNFANITHNLERTINRLCTKPNTPNWKTQLKNIYDEANALTEPHDDLTKKIYKHITGTLLQCPSQGMEKFNYFATLMKGLQEITRILNYRGHTQRRHKQHKNITLKLHKFKSQHRVAMGLSYSSIAIKHYLLGLANYLLKVINVIRNEE